MPKKSDDAGKWILLTANIFTDHFILKVRGEKKDMISNKTRDNIATRNTGNLND